MCTAFFMDAVAQSGLYNVKERWEFGIMGGGATYFGDINPHANYRVIKPGVGVFNRLNMNNRLAFRVGAFMTSVEHADRYSTNPYQKARNLSFRSDIWEVNAQFEFNFMKFKKGHRRDYWTPYMLYGVAVIRMNPQAYDSLNQEWIDLQPLGTEGQKSPSSVYQGDNYNDIQPAFMIGGGFKVSLSKSWCLGAEFAHHRLLTDYLDDLSTRYYNTTGASPEAEYFADPSLTDDFNKIGRPGKIRGDRKDTDAYMTFNLNFTFTIRTSECAAPGNHKF